jgi:hypothetical protein
LSKTLEEEIADGRRVEQLLADPATRGALAALDRQYWNEAKASTSDAGVIAAVAKARALDDLSVKLTAIVHNGKVATATSERQKRR